MVIYQFSRRLIFLYYVFSIMRLLIVIGHLSVSNKVGCSVISVLNDETADGHLAVFKKADLTLLSVLNDETTDGHLSVLLKLFSLKQW